MLNAFVMILASLIMTTEREEYVDFVTPYYDQVLFLNTLLKTLELLDTLIQF